MSVLPHVRIAADIYRAYAAALRPFEYCEPSAWSEKYRVMPRAISPEQPGPWKNDYFPVLGPLMDAAWRAILAGKDVVCIKSAQGGGSAAFENVLGCLLDNYPGPALYIHATQDMARRWGRDHFGHMVDSIPHWRSQEIPGRRHQLRLRAVAFSITLAGGQSRFNFQSVAYRFVVIDEVDSVVEAFKNEGDPVKMAKERTSSFRGITAVIIFAHPTTSERGAGEIYYRDSDQQRAFVECPHCHRPVQLCWVEGTDRQKGDQVARVKCVPHETQTKEDALSDPTTYALWCSCGAEITDSQRWQAMARPGGIHYASTLTADMAARAQWCGLHFSQLYYPNKSILDLARKWVSCLHDEESKKVFIQKTLGEVTEQVISKTSSLDWRRLATVPRFAGDPDAYEREEIPDEVQYLAAGVDSRGKEFHWTIWGFGLRRLPSKATELCAWLIDWGNPKRLSVPKDENDQYIFTEADYWIFDTLLFDRRFQRRDGRAMKLDLACIDEGWPATQMSVHQYCMRKHPLTARACKGDAYTSRHERKALFSNGTPYCWKYQDQEFKDESWLRFNTYALKEMLFKDFLKKEIQYIYKGDLKKGPKLHLPTMRNKTDEEMLFSHLSSEALERGKHGALEYKKHGENHLLDCTIYAFGGMQSLNAFAPLLPYDEQEEQNKQQREAVPLIQVPQAGTVLNRYGVDDNWIRNE